MKKINVNKPQLENYGFLILELQAYLVASKQLYQHHVDIELHLNINSQACVS